MYIMFDNVTNWVGSFFVKKQVDTSSEAKQIRKYVKEMVGPFVAFVESFEVEDDKNIVLNFNVFLRKYFALQKYMDNRLPIKKYSLALMKLRALNKSDDKLVYVRALNKLSRQLGDAVEKYKDKNFNAGDNKFDDFMQAFEALINRLS